MSTIETSFELFSGIIGLYIDYLRKSKKLRKILTIGLAVLTVVSIVLRIFTNNLFQESLVKDVNDLLFGLIIFLLVLFVITIASYTKIKISAGKIGLDLENLRTEREELKKKFSEKHDDVFNTIQLSLNQLTEYYTINLSQARSSYRWSIAAIIVGIITLLAGIWFFYFNANPNINLAIISGVSGVIIEFIGASNIYIYNKSLKQLNLYFRELINIQDTMLAIELSEKIDNNEKKIEIKEKIILSLMGRSSMRVEFLDDFKKAKAHNKV